MEQKYVFIPERRKGKKNTLRIFTDLEKAAKKVHTRKGSLYSLGEQISPIDLDRIAHQKPEKKKKETPPLPTDGYAYFEKGKIKKGDEIRVPNGGWYVAIASEIGEKCKDFVPGTQFRRLPYTIGKKKK